MEINLVAESIKFMFLGMGVVFAFLTIMIFVKRIQRRVDGKLDIISDNKDYPSQILNKNELEILGKVISSFGMVY